MTTKTKNTTTTIPANSKVPRGLRGDLIRRWLPEVKRTYPAVRYIRLEEDGDDLYWVFTSTPDNKKVAEMLRKGEQGALQKTEGPHQGTGRAVTKTVPEHEWGKELTGIVIRKMKRGLELPEGAHPPRFDNDKREWSFRAKDQDTMTVLIDLFKGLEVRCANIYDPPCKGTLELRDDLGSEKRARRFTSQVIKRLREVELPQDAARIQFHNETGRWRFACQTEQDLDILIGRFVDLEKKVYEEFTFPLETAVEPEEKVSQPTPEFNGADFPALPLTPSAV